MASYPAWRFGSLDRQPQYASPLTQLLRFFSHSMRFLRHQQRRLGDSTLPAKAVDVCPFGGRRGLRIAFCAAVAAIEVNVWSSGRQSPSRRTELAGLAARVDDADIVVNDLDDHQVRHLKPDTALRGVDVEDRFAGVAAARCCKRLRERVVVQAFQGVLVGKILAVEMSGMRHHALQWTAFR